MPEQNKELDQYKEVLEKHDWFYSYSDDHSVWQKGIRDESNLMAMAKLKGDEFKKAFNEAYLKRFCPPHFTEVKPPFPEVK